MQYDVEALWRVKIGHFLKRGILIRGVIHVGANDGYEIDWYLKLGIKNILAVEPERESYNKLKQKFKGVAGIHISSVALGDGDRATVGILRVPQGSTGGSTLLTELPYGPGVTGVTYNYSDKQEVVVTTFEKLVYLFSDIIELKDYNCLVVDVQGMELQVLKGFGPHLEKMDCLNIECSETPIYEGEAPAYDVVTWLAARDFYNITPIQAHNDILFVRRRYLIEEVLSG
ncbi:hypothetical protein LCGC14_1749770 [marine sediment metagenome]|uniref:Methyltransferase FkbM domain-containing protein n=1 Tax=marine sediment metagenome TaxID=412755 RepID=A0A0F9K3R4_9ZZZZ